MPALAILARLAPLAPMLLSGASCLALGSGAGWVARDLIAKHIEIPALTSTIERRERDACTIRTLDAANRAEAAERVRQEAAGRAALDTYRQAAEARERQQGEVQDKLEQEIAQNEAALAARGRSCIADDADVRWVRGERGAADPTAGGE